MLIAMRIFRKLDMKDYLLLSSASILNMIKLSDRAYFLPGILVHPTHVCNYRCVFCDQGREKRIDSHYRIGEVMDFSTIEKIVDDCSQFRLLKPRIHFSGLGEPLIYPHLKKTMDLFRKNSIKWSVTTNAYVLDRYAEELIQSGCRSVNVSIHGDEALHNKVTQIKDAFRKSTENIRKLDRLKKKQRSDTPRIAVNCVMNSTNVDKLRKLLGIFSRLPVNSVTFQHLDFQEADMDKGFVLDEGDMKKISSFMEHVENNEQKVKVNFYPRIKRQDVVPYYSDLSFPFNVGCVIPWLMVRILPKGDVEMCGVPYGNVNETSLKEMLNSESARKFRKAVSKGSFNKERCTRCCHRQYY